MAAFNGGRVVGSFGRPTSVVFMVVVLVDDEQLLVGEEDVLLSPKKCGGEGILGISEAVQLVAVSEKLCSL